jgi:hypothetical protein
MRCRVAPRWQESEGLRHRHGGGKRQERGWTLQRMTGGSTTHLFDTCRVGARPQQEPDQEGVLVAARGRPARHENAGRRRMAPSSLCRRRSLLRRDGNCGPSQRRPLPASSSLDGPSCRSFSRGQRPDHDRRELELQALRGCCRHDDDNDEEEGETLEARRITTSSRPSSPAMVGHEDERRTPERSCLVRPRLFGDRVGDGGCQNDPKSFFRGP